ncbi:MAG: N-acetylglucosamine-6-phosphate deacetylase [Lawsonibacter sp.]|jgi:N-acetylglucosamine-6-phosphate deacetylase
MRIGNALLFLNGRFQMGSIAFDRGIITEIGPASAPCDLDAEGMYVVPGFVDVHTHGAMNQDFSDGNPEGLPTLSRYYARHGVTSFLATTMTLKEPVLMPAMEAVGGFRRPVGGAKCAGIHLEGPFLSYAKRGAQAADNLHKPDIAMFRRLNQASGGKVRLVTVAPEEEGGIAFIREASQECTVSIGHTTADYDTAVAAYQAGASHATHLFNGMPSFLHREPGVVGAALDCGASVELICDGLHIHPAMIRAVHKMFGEKLVIISDSLRCAGMPDGFYELGGQPIEMKNGRATLKGSDTLAGSSSNLLDELRNVVSFGLPLEDAVVALTLAPAKAVGLEREIGALQVGKRADLLLLSKDLALKAVYVDGEQTLL